MKKQIVSSIMLVIIAFLLGLTGKVLATSRSIENEDIFIQNRLENVNINENDMQPQGTNTVPTDYFNDINNKLQDIASQQPKDMRKQVTVMVIIIVTVLAIVGLITWYYMTNQ